MPFSRGPFQSRNGTSVSYVSCIDRQALNQLCHLAWLEGRQVKFWGFRRPAESSTGTLWSWRNKGTDAWATFQATEAEPGWSGPLGWWDKERGAWQWAELRNVGSGASFHGGGRTCKSALAWSYLERDSAPKDDLQGNVTPAETQGGVGGRSQGWGLSGHLEEQHECQICPRRGISSGLQKLPKGESKLVGGTPLPPPQALVLGPCTDQALSWSALSPLHAPSLEGPEGDLSRGGTGEMSTVFLLPYFEFLSPSQAWVVTWIWSYSLEVDWTGLPSTCKGRLFSNKYNDWKSSGTWPGIHLGTEKNNFTRSCLKK